MGLDAQAKFDDLDWKVDEVGLDVLAKGQGTGEYAAKGLGVYENAKLHGLDVTKATAQILDNHVPLNKMQLQSMTEE